MRVKEKIFVFLLLSFIVVILSSCCVDCLISNSERSDFDVYKYKNNQEAVKISSADKYIVVLPSIWTKVRKYGIGNKNIISTGDEELPQIELKFRDKSYQLHKKNLSNSNYSINDKDSVESTFVFDEAKGLKVKLKNKVRMNLDNGDVFIRKKISNASERETSLSINNTLSLKSGGYLVLLKNLASEFSNGIKITKDSDIKLNPKNLVTYKNHLILNTEKNSGLSLKTDSSSGYLCYLWNDLLFLKKTPYKRNAKYQDGITLEATINDNNIVLTTPSPVNFLKSDGNFIYTEKWSIIKLKKKVNSIKKVKEVLNKYNIQALVNR